MVEEAWCLLGLELPFAFAKRKFFLNQLKIFLQHLHTWIWTEVRCTVLINITCLEYSRELLICDLDDRISLSILQVDVVLGHVLLDQVILEYKSLVLSLGDDVFDVFYLETAGCFLAETFIVVERPASDNC